MGTFPNATKCRRKKRPRCDKVSHLGHILVLNHPYKKYIWFFFGKKQINFGSILRGSKEKANQPRLLCSKILKSRATAYSPKGFTALTYPKLTIKL